MGIRKRARVEGDVPDTEQRGADQRCGMMFVVGALDTAEGVEPAVVWGVGFAETAGNLVAGVAYCAVPSAS